MKKFISLILAMCAIPGVAQNWTTVTATNITDLNQQKLAAGQLCFLPTDQNDNPISAQIGGGGQALRRQYCSPVSAGAVASFTVPNPAATSPTGLYYRISVKDSSTGQEVLRYTQVTFSGTSFNFDNYAPTNLGSFAPLTGTSVSGNLNVNGNVNATGSITGLNLPANVLQQIFNTGVALTQRTAFNVTAGLQCTDNTGTLRTDCRLGSFTTVSSSPTVAFDASTAATFKLTLSGNVTSSSLTGAVAGEPLAFIVCQDATGGRTFVPPANVLGWITIPTAANACVLETFIYDGSNAQADGDTAGQVFAQDGTITTPSITFENETNTGFLRNGAGSFAITYQGSRSHVFAANLERHASGGVVGWSSNADPAVAAADTGLSRDSSGVIDVGTGAAGSTSGSMKMTRLTASGSGGQANSGLIASASGTPGFAINTTNGAADQKWTDCYQDTTRFQCRFVNDANSVANPFLTVNRGAGPAVGSITFNAGGGVQTLPTATDTLVGRTTADTLANKTLNAASNGNAVDLLNEQGASAALTGNGTDQTLFTYTLPANTLGAGKCLEVEAWANHNSGSGSVTYKLFFGSILYVNNATALASGQAYFRVHVCNNAGSTSAQHGSNLVSYPGATFMPFSPLTSSEVTTSNVVVKLLFNAASTEQVTAENWVVRLSQ